MEKLLSEAVGESQPVIAVNLDVRGFSRFSLGVESVDAAIYIRKIYQHILRRYYSDADFFKLTGDGLLLVFRLEQGDDDDLAKTADRVTRTAIKLVKEFGSLLATDPWIYFDVPQELGIGIARGAASRLFAKGTTLDYSGAALNEASRLMDLARPQGVVLGNSFPFDILKPSLRRRFVKDDRVFISGLAEATPTVVRYVKGWTTIPARNRRPLDEIRWLDIKRTLTLREMMKTRDRYIFELAAEPIDPSKIWAIIDHPKATKSGRQAKGSVIEMDVESDEMEYVEVAGQFRLMLSYGRLAERLKRVGVKRDWRLDLWIRYPT